MDYGNDEQHACHSAGWHAEKTPFHVPILAKQTTSPLQQAADSLAILKDA